MSAHKELDARQSSAPALDPGRTAAQGSSSNRKGTSSINEPPQVRTPLFGVDRVSVSFRVKSRERDLTGWNMVSILHAGTPQEAYRLGTTVKLTDETSAFVGVQEIHETGETWAKVECNPARVLDPAGHSLCPVEEVGGVMLEAIVAGMRQGLFEPAIHAAGEAHLKRLDVARDFHDVDRPGFVISGLGPVQRPWARRNFVHYDPQRQGAQTLCVGSGAGSVRLYDKNAETEGATPGVVRWECEARSSWCENYGGMKLLADVDADTVQELGQNRWEWSAMGHEVTAMETIVEKVMRSGLSFAEQRGLIGYLSMVACGADVRAAKATHAKYRAMSRTLGVALDAEALRSGGGFSARLDLDSGKQVLRVS